MLPYWLAHGGVGSWDEIVVAAIGLALILYFGLIWKPTHKVPPNEAEQQDEQQNKQLPDQDTNNTPHMLD